MRVPCEKCFACRRDACDITPARTSLAHRRAVKSWLHQANEFQAIEFQAFGTNYSRGNP
jgi:hypothetical protein